MYKLGLRLTKLWVNMLSGFSREISKNKLVSFTVNYSSLQLDRRATSLRTKDCACV